MAKKSIIATLLFILFIFGFYSFVYQVNAQFFCNGGGLTGTVDLCGVPPPPPDDPGPQKPNPTSAPSGKQNCKCFNAQGVMVRDTCVDCGSSCGDAPAGGWCELQGNCGECRVCIF